MRLSSSPINSTVRSTPPDTTVIERKRVWTVVVGATGLVLAVLVALSFILLPVYYDQLMQDLTEPEARSRITLLGLSVNFFAMYGTVIAIASAMVFFAVAALIFWRRATQPMGLLVALVLMSLGAAFSGGITAFIRTHPEWSLGVQLLDFFTLPAFVIMCYLFPDGRWVPQWTRFLALGTIIWYVLISVFPVSLATRQWLWVGSLVTMLFAQVYRYRYVSGCVQRQQTKWTVFGIVGALTGFLAIGFIDTVFPWYNQPGSLSSWVNTTLYHLVVLFIPLSIGIALLRHQLWDIDPIINRTLVYGLLTACVVGIYVLIVGYFGVFFEVHNNSLVSLLATAVVAVLFHPLRDRLQRSVNRLMYGRRDEPYAVISQLGHRLEATLAPDAVLPTIVQTVRDALKLPYAAITLRTNEHYRIAAADGVKQDETVRLPLMYQGEQVGELVLAPRAPGESFTWKDKELLTDLTRQAGIAVYAVRLTTDLQHLARELQQTRTQLVTAREEERRRLRRDLHDGLGSVLASLNLRAGAVRSLLYRDTRAADALVVEQQATIRDAIADVRRLVHDLRPAVLDELGLGMAIRELATQYSTPTRLPSRTEGSQHSYVDISMPDVLPPLPAAVEVAAYRIVQEALTNVARHAQAHRCSVGLAIENSALKVEVTDDGIGLPEGCRAGVGLTSMRERAEELGGTCIVEPVPTGGTRVRVELPLRTA